METQGRVVSINVSTEKGTAKVPVASATITPKGIEGDAHAGDWHRQVSLLAEESIQKMRDLHKEKGADINSGDFAENITTSGVDLLSIAIGRRLRLGASVILEVTQIGKECHSGCDIRERLGDCVMPREGIFTRVVEGGHVKVGDAVTIMDM
jgi:MOSC domain-containing protein YiiM